MWEPRSRAYPWASTAYYRDSFIFFTFSFILATVSQNYWQKLNGGSFESSRSFKLFLWLVWFSEEVVYFCAKISQEITLHKGWLWLLQLSMLRGMLIVLLLFDPPEVSNCRFQVVDLLSCKGRRERDVPSEIAMGCEGKVQHTWTFSEHCQLLYFILCADHNLPKLDSLMDSCGRSYMYADTS
jgi:hypothetical protein